MVARGLLPLISVVAHALALRWVLRRIGVPDRRNTLPKAIVLMAFWRLAALLRRNSKRAPWRTVALYTTALWRAYRLSLPHACAIAVLHSVIVGDLGRQR